MKFPKHKGSSLKIIHNEFKDRDSDAADWIKNNAKQDYLGYKWINVEEFDNAIKTNSIWTIQYYNENIKGKGFAASSFEALMKFVNH
jgi:hypothetical protein